MAYEAFVSFVSIVSEREILVNKFHHGRNQEFAYLVCKDVKFKEIFGCSLFCVGQEIRY